MTAEASPARRTQRARRASARLVIFLLLGILVAALAWVGVRGVMAKAEIDQIMPLARELQDAAASGDLDRVDELASSLDTHASAVAELENDPVWRAAEWLPFAGQNLSAVRTAAGEAAAIAGVIPRLTDAARTLAEPHDDVLISPSALSIAAESFQAADDVFMQAAQRLEALDRTALLPIVADGVEQLNDVVQEAAPVLATAARTGTGLPAMLGGDGDRTILVMIQNSAELRTGGGITGSFAELRAQDGRITLVRQADSSEFAARYTDIIDLPESTTTIYSDVAGRFAQNMSMPTDFATTGALATAWWEELTGHTPDTVVSVDPLVLSALLSVIGPVDLDTGEQLTAENLVETLLVAPYRTLSSDEQTSLYAAVTEAVFDRLTAGGFDPILLAQALAEPVAEGRVSIWNADEASNDVFASSVLGGPSARQDAAGRGAFAVYFNDATGAKMAEYLDVAMSAEVLRCRTDGYAEVVVTVTLGSTAPLDVDSLPVSVTGGGHFGVGAGDIGTNVSVVAPRDGSVGAVVVKGEPYAAATAVDEGRPTSAARVNLSPEEVNVLEFHFFVPRDDVSGLTLLHTPLLTPAQIDIGATSCE